MIIKTTDDSSYYNRHKPVKAEFVEKWFTDNSDLNLSTIYDVGCNNGDISYPLQIKFNVDVMGVDLSDNLTLPKDYKFKRLDVVNEEYVNYPDVTLFFSLYHHILGSYGLETADEVFLKLLLRTKYLIFDTGNASETNRMSHNWYRKSPFKSEKELLDHFRLPYKVIGKWSCGGGNRSVVVFNKDDFDIIVEEKQKYKRKKLVEDDIRLFENIVLYQISDDLTDIVLFYKLKFLNKAIFAKKRCEDDIGIEKQELENIKTVYNNVSKNRLIKYYGYSKKYGLIYEWVNDIKFIRKKIELNFDDMNLVDVEEIEVQGERKYIDFER